MLSCRRPMGACRPQRSSRSQLLVRNCVGCMLISGIPGHKVVRVAGKTIPTQPVPPEFPGTYPTGFYEAAMGDKLPNHQTFSSEFRSSLDKILKTKAPQEYEEFMQTGTCNSRQHQWVVLRFPANTYFPVHAHPGLEMVYIVEGTMYEIRLQGKPDFSPVVGEPGPDISSGYEYVERSFGPGSWVVNEVGSIHQSFSRDEAVTLIAVWPSGYVFFPPERLPQGVFLEVNHDVANEVRWQDDKDY